MGCDGRDWRAGVDGPGIGGRRTLNVSMGVRRAHGQGVRPVRQRARGVARGACVDSAASRKRTRRRGSIELALVGHGIRSVREGEIAGRVFRGICGMGRDGRDRRGAAIEEGAGAAIGHTGIARGSAVGWKSCHDGSIRRPRRAASSRDRGRPA